MTVKDMGVSDVTDIREVVNIVMTLSYMQIYEVGVDNMDKQVNQYIDSGWKVISILTKPSGLVGPDIYSDPQIVYTLGWFDDSTPPHFKRETNQRGYSFDGLDPDTIL